MTKPTNKELDCSTAKMLKAGVTMAAVVVFAGGLLLLRHPFIDVPSYSHFHPVDRSLRSIVGITYAALHLDPRAIVQFGLILLIATPVARVVFCLYGFIRQQDKLYTVISSLVLIILLYSLSKGAH
jgi:uncharacterized membrane protein